MPLWHQLMNQKPLFSILENYSQHCQTTLSWSKYYSLVPIGVNRSGMGPRCSSAETQVCHRSYIIAARVRSEVIISRSYLSKLHSSKFEDTKGVIRIVSTIVKFTSRISIFEQHPVTTLTITTCCSIRGLCAINNEQISNNVLVRNVDY